MEFHRQFIRLWLWQSGPVNTVNFKDLFCFNAVQSTTLCHYTVLIMEVSCPCWRRSVETGRYNFLVSCWLNWMMFCSQCSQICLFSKCSEMWAEQLQTAEPNEVTVEQNKCHLAEGAHCKRSDDMRGTRWSLCVKTTNHIIPKQNGTCLLVICFTFGILRYVFLQCFEIGCVL